jgi:hypothetical protein
LGARRQPAQGLRRYAGAAATREGAGQASANQANSRSASAGTTIFGALAKRATEGDDTTGFKGR